MHIPARIATLLTLLGTALAAQIPLVDPSLETISSGTPLPAYVLAHAPLSYLHSSEAWWPSDVARHLRHVEPKRKHQSVAPSVTCANISSLDRHIFLSSKDDPFASPQAAWIGGEGPPDEEGRAEGPATVVAVKKPGGVVDAFYFYFYSYNHMNVSLHFLLFVKSVRRSRRLSRNLVRERDDRRPHRRLGALDGALRQWDA